MTLTGSGIRRISRRHPRTSFWRTQKYEHYAGRLPVRVEKPWGYEIWFAWTDQYVGKIIHVNKGGKLSLQYHEEKDETSYLQSGKLLLTKGATADGLTVTEISAGHQWRNLPGEIHTIEGVEDSDVLEVSTPHLHDVIRLQDNYGREGTNAP